MKRKGFVIALSLIGAVMFVGCAAGTSAAGTQATALQTVQVTRGDIEQAVSAPGVLQFVDPVAQKTTSNVKITDVAVKVGDAVKKGDKIADYDAAALSANIANLDATKSQLEKQLQGQALSFRNKKKIPAGVTGYVKAVYVKEGDSVDAVVAEKGGIALISVDGLMNVQFQGTGLATNDEVNVVSGHYRITGHVSKVEGSTITVSYIDKKILLDSTVEVYHDGTLVGSGPATINLPYLVPGDGGIVTDVKVSVNDYVMPALPVVQVKYAEMDDSYIAAQDQLTQAQLDLDAAKALLAQGAILAEQDGIISSVLPEGTYPSGTTLMNLYPKGEFEFTISVDELDIFSIVLGQSAVVQFDGIPDKTFDAVVTKISSVGQVANGFTTYAVTLSVTDDGTLKSGLNGTVRVIIQQRDNVLTLPVEAIQEDSSGSFVLMADGQQTKAPVEVGISDGRIIEIVSGLAEGDSVIIRAAADISSYAQ